MMYVRAAWLAAALTGCVTSADLGLLQHAPGEGTGGSLTGHWGMGAVEHRVIAAEVGVRGDMATSGDRFAVGANVLGGLPIGAGKVLARAGIWHAVASNTAEHGVVATFELEGFVPLNDHPTDPKHPEYGSSSAGVVFGVREDLDAVTYTTAFVGLALLFSPGY